MRRPGIFLPVATLAALVVGAGAVLLSAAAVNAAWSPILSAILY